MTHLKFIGFSVCLFFAASLAAQDQYRQERDPNKNSELYLIPEIRVGYSFLNTNYKTSVASLPINSDTYNSYTPLLYSATVSFGYHVSPFLAGGLGLGIEQYSQPDGTALPTFIDLRGYLKDAKNTPFANVKLGTCFKFGVFQAGYWANLGVGYKFFAGKTCLTAALGYEFKNTGRWVFDTTIGRPRTWYALNRHSIVLSIGVVLF